MCRPAVALIAVFLLTAFAPAPLPRKEPRGEATITLESCQGTWRIVKDEVVTATGWSQKQPTSRTIRIKGSGWTSSDVQGGTNTDWTITIDGSTRPAKIVWYNSTVQVNQRNASWAGLVRWHQGSLQVTYMNTNQLAQDFTSLPVGAVVLTLRRGE